MSGKRRKRKVLVIAQAVWFHMDRLNISQNGLAELLGRSSPFVLPDSQRGQVSLAGNPAPDAGGPGGRVRRAVRRGGG